MKITKRNLLFKLAVCVIKLPLSEVHRLSDLIRYGTRLAAQREYEFITPSYDEDAGVYTDWGQNKHARTFANIYFTQLLSNAVLEVGVDKEYDWEANLPVEVMLLNMSIPALSHLLVTCLDMEFQKSIWLSKIRSDWESDGHYGNASKDEYIAKELERLMYNRKQLRELQDIIGNTSGNGIKYLLRKEGLGMQILPLDQVPKGGIGI